MSIHERVRGGGINLAKEICLPKRDTLPKSLASRLAKLECRWQFQAGKWGGGRDYFASLLEGIEGGGGGDYFASLVERIEGNAGCRVSEV
jgi:hypothetical protein